VIVLDPHLPEPLQGKHAANAHLMEHLLHYVWKGTGSQTSLAVHRHPQQTSESQVMLMDQVSQGLQDTLLSTLKTSMGQHCRNGLVEELPARGPTQFCDRFAFTSGDEENRTDEKINWLINYLNL